MFGCDASGEGSFGAGFDPPGVTSGVPAACGSPVGQFGG